jgi:MmeI, target recognition domain
MRSALSGLARYVAGIRHGKRLLFVWCEPWTLASDATNVFAFDDDYAIGILSSSTHAAWARSRSSTLEDRLRYTPSTVFESFPWPYPTTGEQRERIAALSRRLIAQRQEIFEKQSFGLTALYNLIDEGAYTDLKALHGELDEAVAAAYGWPKAVAQDGGEIVQRLLILNREIAAGTRKYDPFDEELELIDSVQVDPRLTPESVPVQRRGQVPTEEVIRGSPHQR